MRKIPIFRIFYSTTFTILSILLSVLLLVTPGDAIRQALRPPQQLYIVFVIAAVYILTLFIAIIIYASRLYTNRRVLASIPKTFLPIEPPEVGRRVARLIAEGLARSALVTRQATPRDIPPESADPSTVTGGPQKLRKKRTTTITLSTKPDHPKTETLIPISAFNPPWGHISHPGWSAPSTPDLPNLQYRTVVVELPHLIEAQAVALAPTVALPSSDLPVPDPQILALLQRPPYMTLRDYLAHLSSHNILTLSPSPSSTTIASFLTLYERARFSDSELTEPAFRALMRSFADILRSVQPLDPSLLPDLIPSSSSSSYASASDASSTTTFSSGASVLASSSERSMHTPTLNRAASSRSRPQLEVARSRTPSQPGSVRSALSATGSTSTGESVIRLSLRENQEVGGLLYRIVSGGEGPLV